ncbi:T9SS type A sorting domain-containing protein [bacterium]|nr:T9SS type A sorting domain-containing protein [bacterium]
MPMRITPKHLFCLWFAFLFLGVEVTDAQELDLIWERRGPGPQSRYGGTIFGLGDRNHDGYDDFAVEAWGSGGVGNPSETIIEFFYGGNPPEEEPFFVFRGVPEQDLAISGGYEIGDVNADGLIDWAITFRNFDFSVRWWHFFVGAIDLPATPTWIAAYHDSLWDLDVAPRRVGDVNGDSFDDIYIHGHGNTNLDPGRGAIWFGSADPDSIVDWEIEGDGEYVWPSSGGSGVEDAWGDINGDGFDDILNYRWFDHGPFEVFWGGDQPATISDTIGFNPTEDATAPHIVKDLNGDRRDDIAYAISGSQTAVFLGGETLSPQADFMLHHGGCDDNQGGPWKVDAVGDLNGDGYYELAVTNDFCPGGRGTIWLYFNQSWLNPEPVFTLEGWQFDTWGLREATGVGDVNGDGVDDLGIGAFEDFDFRGWAGILAGNPDIHVSADETPPAIVNELEVSAFPNPFNITTTIEISGITGGGECDVSIFNVLGQQVVTERLAAFAGHAKYVWNADAVATGLYIVEVHSATQFATTKLLLMK